ncbi:MAG: hypothetical protein ACR2NZ_16335 [Rubripirellula sp.]
MSASNDGRQSYNNPWYSQKIYDSKHRLECVHYSEGVVMGFFRTIAGLSAIYLTYLGFEAMLPKNGVSGVVDTGLSLTSALPFVVGAIFCVSFVVFTRNYDAQERVFQLAKRYAKDEISLDEYSARTKGILIP